MDPTIVIPGVAAAAICYVAVPTAFIEMSSARRDKSVECPADGEVAYVRVDPRRTLLRLIRDTPHRVIACSRWPDRASCDRACAAVIA